MIPNESRQDVGRMQPRTDPIAVSKEVLADLVNLLRHRFPSTSRPDSNRSSVSRQTPVLCHLSSTRSTCPVRHSPQIPRLNLADVADDYPAEHWRHIRTTNAIESTFATVRHRTSRTKNCVSHNSFIGLGFKMLQQAEKRWIAIFHPEKVRDLFAGMKFIDGLPANETLPDDQQDAA